MLEARPKNITNSPSFLYSCWFTLVKSKGGQVVFVNASFQSAFLFHRSPHPPVYSINAMSFYVEITVTYGKGQNKVCPKCCRPTQQAGHPILRKRANPNCNRPSLRTTCKWAPDKWTLASNRTAGCHIPWDLQEWIIKSSPGRCERERKKRRKG